MRTMLQTLKLLNIVPGKFLKMHQVLENARNLCSFSSGETWKAMLKCLYNPGNGGGSKAVVAVSVTEIMKTLCTNIM